MIRAACITLVALFVFLVAPRARADATDAKGIAVVAADGATDAAWPLARAIYGSALLRPENIDDAHARVLAGETPTSQAPSLTDLAELRAGVKGDDAASRQLLVTIADKVGVASILVVFAGEPPSARLFDAKSRAFDAASYAPDASSSSSWDGAIRALERPFAPTTLVSQATAAPTSPLAPHKTETKSKQFYESPWFWAAIGAVLLIGGGVLIATNVQTGDTIHLQMKLP